MTNIDTSAEAAEYVCRPLDEEAQMQGHNTHIAADMIRALTSERDRLRAALECARSICDTPIARRRLGIEPSYERISLIRAALKETGK